MKILLPQRDFFIWLWGLAAAIGGVASAGAHVWHNFNIGDDDLNKSIVIFLMITIGAIVIIAIGYPRRFQGRLFRDITDGAKETFFIRSQKFKLALKNLLLTDDRVVIIEMNWDFDDKKTGTNFLGFSSLKDEEISCLVDITQNSEVLKSFEVQVTNTRTSSSEDRRLQDIQDNKIEIDSKDVVGEVDVIFSNFYYRNKDYDITQVVLNVKVDVGLAFSNRNNYSKTFSEKTHFEVTTI